MSSLFLVDVVKLAIYLHNNIHSAAMADLQVLIIGGGFAGVCMAIKLLKAGHSSFLLIEKLPDFGGTWFLNRYPGCRCDIPSHFFSYSFDRNPNWSSMYVDRSEIQQYLKDCATRHGILPHVRLSTVALSVTWDADNSLWQVVVKKNEAQQPSASVFPSIIKARFVVRATGLLHVPKYPDIKGIEEFTGLAFHSSLWDSNISLEGKTMAVIGTGASAIQMVPGIAPAVKKLYVFQRTAAWVSPRPGNWGFPKGFRRLFAQVPQFTCLLFWLLFLLHEIIIWAVLRWNWARRVGEWLVKWNIRGSLKDPALIEKLVPKFEMGCKRIVMSNDFYTTLARSNVELITEQILEMQENALLVRGRDRPIPLDAIVYATGFHVAASLPVVGVQGIEYTQAGYSSLFGITKRGFPNFFTFFGYNAAVGQTSQILVFEAQARYILSCMALVSSRPCRSLEPTDASERRHQRFLAERLPKFVWSFGGCSSWYMDHNRHNFTMWPAPTLEYVYLTWSANARDYDIQWR